MFFSPLEQFDVLFLRVYFFSDDAFFIFNNFNFYLLFFIYFFFFIFIFFKMTYISSLIQYCFETLYLFLLNILIQQVNVNSLNFFPFIYTIFFIILFLNLLGMLPFGFTLTAHLFFTFFFAFSFNLGFFFFGLYLYDFNFFFLFVPSNAPKFLIPLITLIEVVSYFIRTFSLSIRLFANMMAGHCLLYVISMFVFNFFNISIFFFLPVVFIYFIFFTLELAIAFLQAYVFTILVCIYLNDNLNINH
jgi:ATP synthase subunit 6